MLQLQGQRREGSCATAAINNVQYRERNHNSVIHKVRVHIAAACRRAITLYCALPQTNGCVSEIHACALSNLRAHNAHCCTSLEAGPLAGAVEWQWLSSMNLRSGSACMATAACRIAAGLRRMQTRHTCANVADRIALVVGITHGESSLQRNLSYRLCHPRGQRTGQAAGRQPLGSNHDASQRHM